MKCSISNLYEEERIIEIQNPYRIFSKKEMEYFGEVEGFEIKTLFYLCLNQEDKDFLEGCSYETFNSVFQNWIVHSRNEIEETAAFFSGYILKEEVKEPSKESKEIGKKHLSRTQILFISSTFLTTIGALYFIL